MTTSYATETAETRLDRLEREIAELQKRAKTYTAPVATAKPAPASEPSWVTGDRSDDWLTA